MKKLSALLLALLLAATLCFGAMAETATETETTEPTTEVTETTETTTETTAEPVSYVGAWALSEIRSGEVVMDPAMMGMDMSIVLNEDGTCTLSTMGMTEQGTWAATEGGVSLTDAAGTTNVFTYRDGALVLASEGIEMILTPAAPAEEPEYANILPNLTLADFAGAWELDHVESTYGWYSAADLGAGMTVVITDDDAVITMSNTEQTISYNALLATEEADGLGTILWASFLDEAGEPDGTGMMFLLYDDGQLVWYEYDSAEEAEYFYCFNQVTE